MITSPSGKKYIGQTIQCLEKRWKQHVDASKRSYKDHCKVLNKSLRKYGDSNFKIEVLEECENECLDNKELEYIEKYDTIVPNGMNIKKGGANGTHHNDTKQKISESLKGRKISNETRLKMSKNKEYDLPMYVLKIRNGYRICNHPMGPERKFASKYESNDDKYNKAIEYLNLLNNLTEPIVAQKRNITYISKHKAGYAVKYPNEKPKYFVSKNIPNEILYENAVLYLNQLKNKNAVQRLNDSGESSILIS
jgi:group I intron endonuclease